MSQVSDGRLASIEQQLEALVGRIEGLEARVGGAYESPAGGTSPAPPRPAHPVPPPPASAAAPGPTRAAATSAASVTRAPTGQSSHAGAAPATKPGSAAPSDRGAPAPDGATPAHGSGFDLEELLGGRLLAWIGGIAIVLGAAFFVAVAINRGWIDEPTRIAIAAIASIALLGTGIWLRERRGATQASLAVVGAAVASLYLTLVAATQLYDLVPVPVALVLALANGALASLLAARWNAPAIAGLGILGALLAPPLVGAETSAVTAGFLLVALVAAVSVVVWRRWAWLAVAAFAVTAPQLADLGLGSDPGTETWLATGMAGAFWALATATAAALEPSRAGTRLSGSSIVLVVGAALTAALAGAAALAGSGVDRLADFWILALAIAHGVAGLALLRRGEEVRSLALLMLGVGVSLGDLAAPLLLDGALLVLAWAAGGLTLAAIALTPNGAGGSGAAFARIACGCQLGLAGLRILGFADGRESPFSDSPASAGELFAILAVAVAAAACARLAPRAGMAWRGALEALAIVALTLLTALVLDGAGLVAALALLALGLVGAAVTGISANARVVLGGAAALVLVALAQALTFHAPPDALRDGLDSAVEALLAIGVLAGVLAGAARPIRRLDARAGRSLVTIAAAAMVYLASVLIVTAFGPESVADSDGRQRGQLILSAFWGLTGLAALLAGLVRDTRGLRLGGFSLLVLAIGKVFLLDLAQLDSLYRVLSCVALGLASLLAALAWQRIRPRPPDAAPSQATG